MPTAYIKRLAKETPHSVQFLEGKWDEAKKAVKDPTNFGLIMHVFKNKVGIKSAYVTAEELFQFPSTMNSHHASFDTGSHADAILQGIAYAYDKQNATSAAKCPPEYQPIVDALRKRDSVSDKFWLFGTGIANIQHVVLTDQNNRVLVDRLKGQGGIKGASRYQVGDKSARLIGILEVSEWFDQFFDPGQ